MQGVRVQRGEGGVIVCKGTSGHRARSRDGSGFTVSGVGISVSGLGFSVSGFSVSWFVFWFSGFQSRCVDTALAVGGPRSRVSGLGSQISRLEFQVPGLGLTGLEFQVAGIGS